MPSWHAGFYDTLAHSLQLIRTAGHEEGANVGRGLVPRLGRPAVREMQALCWPAGVRRRRVSLVGGKFIAATPLDFLVGLPHAPPNYVAWSDVSKERNTLALIRTPQYANRKCSKRTANTLKPN